MKSNNRFKKVIFGWVLVFSLIFGLTYIPTFAETSEYTDPDSGIKYKLDVDLRTATVTRQDHDFTGTVEIPYQIYPGSGTYAVVAIEDEAFMGYNVPALKISSSGNNIKTIGKSAFEGCNISSTLEIKSNITTIGESAFAENNFTKVILWEPQNIGPNAFGSCKNLINFEVHRGNYVEYDGALYTYSGELVCYPAGRTGAAEIPKWNGYNFIRKIGSYAFSGCKISSIDLGNTYVTEVGEYALYSCQNLQSISFGTNIKSISKGMFAGCSSLTNITIPERFTLIGDSAFSGCTSLRDITIPKKVTSIGERAFENCRSFTKVVIPTTVDNIGENAFSGCNKLSHLYVGGNINFSNIGLEDSTNVWNYEIPSIQSEVPEGKTKVIIQGRGRGNTNFLYCNGMGEKYVIGKIMVDGVRLAHDLTVSANVKPTCTENGHIAGYTCKYCGRHFSDEYGETEINKDNWEIQALGHDYGAATYTWSEDNRTCTAKRVCLNDENHVETETVNTKRTGTTATCITGGITTYEAEFENEAFATQTKTDEFSALGHDYGAVTYTWSEDNSTCTATRVCKNDPEHIETETVATTSEVTILATCTKKGTTTYTATFTNTDLGIGTKDEENIPVDENAHKWSEVRYIWSDDNEECTARRVCLNDRSHIEEESSADTIIEVKSKATCTTAKKIKYTAMFENEVFETQAKIVDEGQALGHAWGEVSYTWSDDNSTCTATRVCGNDANHVETETVDVKSEVILEPTCIAKGLTNYTADFTNPAFLTQIKSVIIPATGHIWGEPTYIWSNDRSLGVAKRVCENDSNHVKMEIVSNY